MINKIIHGDCLDVMRDIPAGSIDMVLCDLPYGVTDNNWDIKLPLDLLWAEYKRLIKPNGVVVLTAMQPFSSQLIIGSQVRFKYSWVWCKSLVSGFLNAKKQPLREHEDVLVFYDKQCTYNPQIVIGKPKMIDMPGKQTSNYNSQRARNPRMTDTYYPKSLIKIPAQRIKNGHPTQKPVALFEYLIKTYTNQGDLVLDNCIGSGTTAIAALNTGRRFIGIEKDEQYCNLAIQRVVLVE